MHKSKKGFTIVELVIVIAVIAILAAVLIPTFSNLVKKANLSADQQAVRQMNTVLSAEFATKTPATLKEIVDVLDAEGYNVNSLTPLTKNHTFYWCEGTKNVVLVEGANTVVYPADATFDANKAQDINDGARYINVKAATADAVKTALINGSDVTLEADITLDVAISLNSGEDITIDLNGYDIDASSYGGRPFEVSNGTALTINANGSTVKCGKYGLIKFNGDGTDTAVTVNGGTFIGELDNGAFIKLVGKGTTNITLNNVNYTDTSSGSYILNCGDADETTIAYLTINGGSYAATFGFQSTTKTVIDGATITTGGFAIEAEGASAITNCIIKSGSTDEGGIPTAAISVASEVGTDVTVSNCTIEAATYAYAVCGDDAKLTVSNNTLKGVTTELKVGNGQIIKK